MNLNLFNYWSNKKRNFNSLNDAEILALAISAEEDDARIYRSYAQKFEEKYPESAKQFYGMAEEEDQHRQSLIDLYKDRFGDNIALIRREHVKGFPLPPSGWLDFSIDIETARQNARAMEITSERFVL